MDVSEEKTGTFRAEAHGHAPIVHTIAIEGNGSRPSHKRNGYKETDKMYTLNTTEVHGVAKGAGNNSVDACLWPDSKANTVRRLTPLECERLQGLPDGYTLINDSSCRDSARYKALGNGMAQPCADYIIRRIVEVSENE
jgi:DNA (cytosine-5)-methyltransferase 1